MPKSIVICCDGTWNSDNDASPTNVAKLSDFLLREDPTRDRPVVYYDSGVGTRGGPIERLFDGVTGYGVSENIRQAYRVLIDNYAPGDDLYFFGFSRGAFTVRSLAGLVRNCGILRRDRRDLVAEAYDFYRDRDPAKRPDAPPAEAYRRAHAVEPATFIHFIGVWETVGALGDPLLRHSLINRGLRFHDLKLSSYVRNAFQALAIDEYRRPFQPAIWQQQPHARGQVMRQVWFIGSHSDVGGGYRDAGLSNIALDWLARRAIDYGLRVDEAGLSDLLGDAFPADSSVPHDSDRGFYWWLPSGPRAIDAPAAGGAMHLPTHERLHWTVIERHRRDPGYRPGSLVDYLERKPGALDGEPRSNALLEGPGDAAPTRSARPPSG
jgi:uncharacterized protein (DUF2235 family)